MISRALGPAFVAAGLLLPACGNSGGTSSGGVVGEAPRPAPAASEARLERPSAAASEAPPGPPASSSAPSLPVASAAPAASAPALPTTQPLPVRAAASAAPAASAAAPRMVLVDGGAGPARDGGASDAGAGDAGAASPALRLAQQVDAIFARARTYSAHFKQHYTAKITGTVKESSGVVSLERPGKMSFRYDPPVKNRIVSDGTTLKVYIADDAQMFESPVQKTQYPGALSFMMGSGIATSFDFSIVPSRYAGTVLEGKPLVPNPSYQTVTFLVDTAALSNGDLRSMAGFVIVDAQGNKNRFELESPAQPASFPPDEFTFTPPPGTTITR